MLPNEKDVALLWDMLAYSREVVELCCDSSFIGFTQDRKTQLAIERCIEIIGEAARKISDDFKQDHVQIPWRAIIAQRHILAHEYAEIRDEKIYRVATIHIPELIKLLKDLVPAPPTDYED